MLLAVQVLPAAADAEVATSDESRTYDEQLLEVSAVVPRFGGFYGNASGDLFVWLTGEPDLPTAEAVVEQLAITLDQPALLGRTLHTLRAEHTWAELFEWKGLLIQAVYPNDHTVFWDIADDRNRIEVGVTGVERHGPAIRRAADDLGIPHRALEILESGPNIDDSQRFIDVAPGSTHAKGITWLADQGIAQGFDDGTFRPAVHVTRAQMASFLDRALDLPIGGDPGFDDVAGGSTHGQAIANLAAAGIATGFEDGSFRPTASITRAQMASFLDRALDLPAGPDPGYSDVTTGSTHARSIGALAAAGITTGFDDGTYRPADPVTRGQLGSFLHRGLS